jgi:branched-chain amino acid transport system substrate-binding protein
MKTRNKWWTRGLTGLGAGAIALTMVAGPTGLASTAGAATNSGASAPGVTATSITVGGLIEKTSASGYTNTAVEQGAKAYFNTVNAAGGVNGRKINYVTGLDDTGDPSNDLQQAQALVQQDHVFAVDPVATTAFSSGGTYLVQQNVPFFGNGVAPAFCNNTMGFGYTGCLVPSDASDKVATTPAGLVTDYLKKEGKSSKHVSVALISEDSVSGSFGMAVSKAAFVADGYNVVYAKAAIPATSVSDWSPYVNAIMTADNGKPPAIMYFVTTPPNTIGLTAALGAAGYKGLKMDPTSYNPAYLSDAQSRAALQGELTWTQQTPFETKTPAVVAETKALRKVVGPTAPLTEQMQIGYWSAAVFVAILKKTGPTLTRDSFLKAANKDFNYGVTGGLGTVEYPEDHTATAACGQLMLIKRNKFVPEVPLTCFTNVPLSIAG